MLDQQAGLRLWAPVPAFGALEHGRIGAVVHAFGWPTIRSIGSAENPWAADAKAAKKLFTSESHRAFFAVICIILPTKADFGFGDGDNPMVGDGTRWV